MLTILSSNNPKFSYCISKNPLAPPRISDLRSGNLVGWFANDNIYCLRFVDAPNTVSFKTYDEEDFEYLSAGQFVHPLCAMTAISNSFALKEEHDIVSANQLQINHLFVKDKTRALLEKHKNPAFTLTFTPCEHYKNYFQVNFSCGNCTLQQFLDYCLSQLIFILFDSYPKTYLDNSFVVKYAKLLDKIDAPYFIRYIFKTNTNGFATIKQYLEHSDTNKYVLTPHSNFESRINTIRDWVKSFDSPPTILDIGCGEGRYYKSLSKYSNEYHCVDVREEMLERVKKWGCEYTYNDISLVPDNIDFIGIMTEVIEHIEIDDISNFFAQIPAGVKKLFLTTP